MLAAISNHDVEHRPLFSASSDILRAYGGCWAEPITEDFALKITTKLRNVFIISVEHRRASRRKRLDQLVLRARNLGNRSKEFQMDRRDIGDNTDFRQRDLRQGCDLA